MNTDHRLNSDLEFRYQIDPQESLRHSLNEHIYDLLTPELTSHIIEMTVKKLKQGARDDELIRYQNHLFDKYIIMNQLTNFRKEHKPKGVSVNKSNNLAGLSKNTRKLGDLKMS